MLPGSYVQVQKMPLLQNGKIDKKALLTSANPQMDRGTEYVKPVNDIEAALVAIWEEILQKQNIGVLDNFFELGGHSLRATTVLHRIRQRYHVHIGLRQIFQTPFIRPLAKEIQKQVWMQQSEKLPLEAEEQREILIL